LRQVFLNLLTNAIEASQAGSILEIHTQLQPGVYATIASESRPRGIAVTIADNGTGIAPSTLPNLFQPFFTTKGEHGTGLGLWVSKGIVEKHGGKISIESWIGGQKHGTTVTVFLPSVEGPVLAT
jgi:signal transduction histidine kinase